MSDRLYKIYCENKDREAIEFLIASHIDSFTVTEAIGYYKGTKEKSIVIEVFNTTREIINNIAQEIISIFQQESVAIVEIPCYADLVFKTQESDYAVRRN
jgi:predicted LPLAT superfamily acyltransferase